MIMSHDTTMVPPFTLPLGKPEASDAQVVGTKAATLGRLRAAGFPVPDGFVVSGVAVADLQRPELRDEIEAALDALGAGSVAVRSSAAAEDLAGASFAGQYESVLDVEGSNGALSAREGHGDGELVGRRPRAEDGACRDRGRRLHRRSRHRRSGRGRRQCGARAR